MASIFDQPGLVGVFRAKHEMLDRTRDVRTQNSIAWKKRFSWEFKKKTFFLWICMKLNDKLFL